MATITKRGDSYRIRVSDGYDVHGKQIMRSMTWTPTPGMSDRQIEKELNRQAVLFEEAKSATANVKFEVFAEQWFRERVEGGKLKENTREKYRRLSVRTYKAIGHLRLDKITKRHIQLFINNLEEDGINQVTKKKLSSKSVSDYLSFVSSIFSYAIELNMLKENPCRGVKVSVEEYTDAIPQSQKYYSLEEAREFLKCLQPEAPLRRVFFLLDIFVGLRKGEILGLEWSDINFDTGVTPITREAEYTKDKGHYTDKPKSKKSTRYAHFPKIVMDALLERKQEQEQDQINAGDLWQDTNRIFTDRFGNQLGSSSMYNWVTRFCEKNNLRKVGIHSFRHFNAALLISEGVDVETVADMLGHAQTSTTLNIYGYAFQEMKAKATKTISKTLTTKQRPKKFKLKRKPQKI